MANTRKEIIDELKALLEQDVTAIKDQVDHLKTQFYTVNEETAEPVESEESEEAPATETAPAQAEAAEAPEAPEAAEDTAKEAGGEEA